MSLRICNIYGSPLYHDAFREFGGWHFALLAAEVDPTTAGMPASSRRPRPARKRAARAMPAQVRQQFDFGACEGLFSTSSAATVTRGLLARQ
jgi:hypothetical protein